MTIEDTLSELANTLETGPAAERREAVRQAAGLLRDPRCRQPCRQQILALLRARVEEDTAFTVRDDAAKVLTNIPEPVARSLLPDDGRHVIRVQCPRGHLFHADKRILCSEKTIFVREVVREGGVEMHRIWLACPEQGCGERFVWPVPCGEYR
jgi:hypothetical protein